jgi:SagB-type dehydrogenase family enzyme
MKKAIETFARFGVLLSLVTGCLAAAQQPAPKGEHMDVIRLPEPRRQSNVSVESALQKRRSVREYRDEPLTLSDLSQLLWAAQGFTGPGGARTVPSAGALYPLEVYLVAGRVNDLASGIYRYRPQHHELVRVAEGDKRASLAAAALDQDCVRNGAVTLVLAAVYERVTKKYGQRGVMYAHMEAGHASQNVYLQAVALNLGTVAVGAFEDEPVKKLLTLPADEQPLYLLPVGRPK